MVSPCHDCSGHFGPRYRCPNLQQRPKIFWQVLSRRDKQCLSPFIHIPKFLSFSGDIQLRKFFLQEAFPLWSPANKALKQDVRRGVNVTEETKSQAKELGMKNPPMSKAPRKTEASLCHLHKIHANKLFET